MQGSGRGHLSRLSRRSRGLGIEPHSRHPCHKDGARAVSTETTGTPGQRDRSGESPTPARLPAAAPTVAAVHGIGTRPDERYFTIGSEWAYSVFLITPPASTGPQHPLSYDERNVAPQCARCNFFGAKGMASIDYAVWMINKYGPGIVEELKIRKSEPYLRRAELEELIKRLR